MKMAKLDKDGKASRVYGLPSVLTVKMKGFLSLISEKGDIAKWAYKLMEGLV